MISFFDKKIYQPNDKVYFLVCPTNKVYRYFMFVGIVQKVIDDGDSYFYQITPTKILEKQNTIKALNHCYWKCVSKGDGRNYNLNKKFMAIDFDGEKFLSFFERWDLNVLPALVYSTKKEAVSSLRKLRIYLYDKLETELEYLKACIS